MIEKVGHFFREDEVTVDNTVYEELELSIAHKLSVDKGRALVFSGHYYTFRKENLNLS